MAFHQFPIGPGSSQPLRTVRAFPALEFDAPVLAIGSNDGTNRIFVGQQNGLIVVFDNTPEVSTSSVFLDLRPILGADIEEVGLQGFVLDPDFARNGLIYVNYVTADPLRTVVARYTSDRSVADPDSARVLLAFDQPERNHNGGGMAFGPDGMLYIGSGDGTNKDDRLDRGQAIDSFLGAILRIRPDGTAPADNPFNVGDGAPRSFVWAIGLRNPWRLQFEEGELWTGDIGQNSIEEIDIVERGANYGWPVYEGDAEFRNPDGIAPDAFHAPLVSYGREAGACVISGCIYRGSALPEFAGAHIYGDFVSGRIWALRRDGSRISSNEQVAWIEQPVSFTRDENGELLICSRSGALHRLEASPTSRHTAPERLSETGLFSDLRKLEPAPELFAYEVRTPLWSDGADKRRWIAIPPGQLIHPHPNGAWGFPIGTVLVKHFELAQRRIETRVLFQRADGWEGHSYRWHADGRDATRVREPITDAIQIEDRVVVWDFPGPSDCFRCHTEAADTVLGVRSIQLRRLEDWKKSGMMLPNSTAAATTLPSAARAYLDTNCAHCHRPGGPTPVDMDLRASTPLEQMRIVDVPPSQDPLAWPGERRLLPGQRERSSIWERMRRRDGHGMPPIGTRVPDPEGLERIGAWIDSMR